MFSQDALRKILPSYVDAFKVRQQALQSGTPSICQLVPTDKGVAFVPAVNRTAYVNIDERFVGSIKDEQVRINKWAPVDYRGMDADSLIDVSYEVIFPVCLGDMHDFFLTPFVAACQAGHQLHGHSCSVWFDGCGHQCWGPVYIGHAEPVPCSSWE